MIPTNSGAFQESKDLGFDVVNYDDPLSSTAELRRKTILYQDLIKASAIPSWESVYFVRGGYIGAKCANLGKPIKFQMYFINGPALRGEEPQLANSSAIASEELDDVYELCLNDIYPVFQIKHEDCASLSRDMSEGCLQKIQQKEIEHYKHHGKTSLEPFSRVQQGLDVFCFLLDTLPIEISVIPQVEDESKSLTASLIDFSFEPELAKDEELVGFKLIQWLLDKHENLQQQDL